MKWESLPAGEWLPDQPDLANPGVITATNVIPAARSYIPLSGSISYSVATTTGSDDYIRGAVSVKDANDVNYTFAGDAKDLYQLTGTAWDVVSKSAGAYSATAITELWTFAKWGNTVIATNYNNTPQQVTLGSPPFADMTGTTTFRARYVDVVKDFVVFGSMYENAAPRPNRIKWSAFNNANNYTPNQATQSDFQDLAEGGLITGLKGGEYGVIWQEYAIRKMVYEGPPRIFRLDKITDDHGCRIPGSIVKYANYYYYMSDDDFNRYDGESITPLGAEKWVKYFYDDLDDDNKHRINTVIDPRRHIVMMAYPGAGNTGGMPNKILIFNWAVKKGSVCEVEADALFTFLSPGYTLEQLDNVSASLDALTFSLDSRIWKGGTPQVAAFNSNNLMYTFDGVPYNATVDTTEFRDPNGKRHDIMSVRPLVETVDTNGGSFTVRVGHRSALNNSPTWTAQIAPNTLTGECDVRVNDRYSRVRIETSGQFTHIIGADVMLRSAGRR